MHCLAEYSCANTPWRSHRILFCSTLQKREPPPPYRARTTEKRVATSRPGSWAAPPQASPPVPPPEEPRGTTAAAFRSPRSSAPPPPEDDYVRVDVDPLDPFSPARAASERSRSRKNSPFPPGLIRSGAGDDVDDGGDDWIPLIALFGLAGSIWLFGILSNALPAAGPTVGM